MLQIIPAALIERLRSDEPLTPEDRALIASCLETLREASLALGTLNHFGARVSLLSCTLPGAPKNALPMSFVAACENPSRHTWDTIQAVLEQENNQEKSGESGS